MNSHANVVSTSIVVGFAMFAMLFGAGNIIFPPSIGVAAGKSWFLGFAAYFFADIGLALLVLAALLSLRAFDRLESIFFPLGRYPALILTGGVIFSVSYLAGPRTCMVSYELAVVPVFGNSDWGLPIFSIIYFGIAWLFCMREDKVVDCIGKYLTPFLVIGLNALIIIGMINPLGPVAPSRIDNVWTQALTSGYQTMDATCAVIFGYLLSRDLHNKGYVSPEAKARAFTYSAWVVGVLMFTVYGGLCYIGATASSFYGLNVPHGELIVSIFARVLGFKGLVLLGLVVLMACLSTGSALAGAAATFASRLSNGRLGYRPLIALLCFSQALIANLGLDNILAVAAPVVLMIFPSVLLVSVLALFSRRLSNYNIYKGGVVFALFYSLLDVCYSRGMDAVEFITLLPLYEYGFGWVLPGALGCLLGALFRTKIEKPKPPEQPRTMPLPWANS